MHDKEFPFHLPRDLRVLEAPLWLVDETPAWIEHIPFAFWLVSAAQPRILVELGTHYGNSYFAFAQSIQALGLSCATYAVDTWQGDDQAGFYGEEVFQAVTQHNQDRYSAFSSLVRSTFDEASGHFDSQEIDVLHIDGHHTYSSVKRDFDTWLPLMSDRGVVMFHDVAVRERDFGVHRLWSELSSQYPAFAFTHGHGLGVLGVGQALPEPLKPLLNFGQDSTEAHAFRQVFSRLGGGLSDRSRVGAEIAAARAEAQEEIAAVRADAQGEIAAVRAEAQEEIADAAAARLVEAESRDVEHVRQLDALRYEAILADQRAAVALDRRIARAASGDVTLESSWDD